MGTKYYPAKLIQIPSKGNKWFVVITKPKELRAGSKNLQVRRTTRTSDKREAEILMPGIATDIYAEFDTALLQYDKAPKHPEITYSSPEDAAKLLRDDPLFMRRMLPPLEKPKNSKSLLSRTINDYLDYIETNQIGDIRERKTREKKCKEFLGLIGDIHLEDIKRIHAYQYADWMAEKGLANKTIKSAISRISVMLTRAEQRGILEFNPFTNIQLANYGRAAKSWMPFEPNELKQLFAQQMPDQERLIMTLLATTGARLDEIALLDWSQVKNEHGITYLDLREAERVKNSQSQRIIPIHSRVAPMLSNKGVGRVFNYPKDQNGKAQNSAGKKLACIIDAVIDHPLKVTHSFRGTFKDMLKNAGVTPEMVEKLDTGELSLSEIADTINSQAISKELNDRITGHVQKDVAGQYGVGHALIPRAAAVEKLNLDFLPE